MRHKMKSLVAFLVCALGLSVPIEALGQGPPLPWSTSDEVCEYCLGTVVACADVPLRAQPTETAAVLGTVSASDTATIVESLYRVLIPETLVFRKRVVYVRPVYGAPDTTVFSPGDTLYVLRPTSEGSDPEWWYRGAPMLGSFHRPSFDNADAEVLTERKSEVWHLVEDRSGSRGWLRVERGITSVPNHYDPEVICERQVDLKHHGGPQHIDWQPSLVRGGDVS